MELVKGNVTEPIEIKDKVTVAKYDPNKNYNWESNATFVLTGNDFGMVINTLRMIVSTPISMKTFSQAMKAAQAMEVSLKAAVELGIAKEVAEEVKK